MRAKRPIERLLEDDSGEFQAFKNARGESGRLPMLIIYGFSGAVLLTVATFCYLFFADVLYEMSESARPLTDHEIVHGRRKLGFFGTITSMVCFGPIAFVAGACCGMFTWALVYRRRNS
jgi:hypothetical protein